MFKTLKLYLLLLLSGKMTIFAHGYIFTHLFYIYCHSLHPSLDFFQKNLVTFDTIHHLASLGQTKPSLQHLLATQR